MEPKGLFVSTVCANCQKPFNKTKSEFNRSEKLGRKHFCHNSCSTSFNNKVFPRKSTTAHLPKGRLLDDLSPFRWFALRCSGRTASKGATDITPEYLSKLWERQKGICPYTGWSLMLPVCTVGFASRNAKNASLDRMDCSRGYVQGNVQFVSIMANYAKNTFCDSDLVDFCKAVALNRAS